MKIISVSKGYTLVEVMIVVAIIGLLASIALPNFIRSRTTTRRNTCINNLRLISAAKDQSTLENGYQETSVLSSTDITPYMKSNLMPTCPATGIYTVNAVSVNPVCSLSTTESHTIS